jgi:hypothetical protein
MPIDRYLNNPNHNPECSKKNCPICMAARDPAPANPVYCCSYTSPQGTVYVYTPMVESLLAPMSVAPTSGSASDTLMARGSKAKTPARMEPPKRKIAKSSKPASKMSTRGKKQEKKPGKKPAKRRSTKR